MDLNITAASAGKLASEFFSSTKGKLLDAWRNDDNPFYIRKFTPEDIEIQKAFLEGAALKFENTGGGKISPIDWPVDIPPPTEDAIMTSASSDFAGSSSGEDRKSKQVGWVVVGPPLQGLPRSDMSRQLESEMHKALSRGPETIDIVEPPRDEAPIPPPTP